MHVFSVSFYFFVWTFTVFSVSRTFQKSHFLWKRHKCFVRVDRRLQILSNGLSDGGNLVNILLWKSVGRAPVEPQIPQPSWHAIHHDIGLPMMCS